MLRFVTATTVLLLSALTAGAADEYRVEAAGEAPPADEISAEIAAVVAPEGFKVIKGTSRTVCEFWPVKQLETKPEFKPTASLLYPLEMGQLVGVVRFRRDGEDFRGQEIVKGTYTVRFALQPEDGNHVGTSDTRDFCVLLKAADDRTPAVVGRESLMKLSAAAAGTTHPCMLSLLAAPDAAPAAPTLEHVEDRELWAVAFAMATKSAPLPLRLVVVGKAAE